jgi:stage II sporulation protein AA (anti-sigma F factor antagonist)
MPVKVSFQHGRTGVSGRDGGAESSANAPDPGPSAAEETVTHLENADQPARFFAEHYTVEGVRVALLRGELDLDAREQLRAALHDADGVPPRIVADLSAVTFLDSSGLNVFITTYHQVRRAGGWVRIAGAQEAVMRVLQLTGVDGAITCYQTVEQALVP